MAFDPSKPFTVSDADMAFDPGKPFTVGPSVSNRSGITLGNLIAHPVWAMKELGSRFAESAKTSARDWTTVGVGSKALSRAVGPDVIEQAYGAPDRKALAPAPSPAASPLDMAADLAGGFVGSVATPESLIGLPGKVGLKATTALGGILKNLGAKETVAKIVAPAAVRAAEGAAVNAAVDVPLQGANIAMGDQDKYDLGGTALNAAFGGVLGGGMGAMGGALKVRGERTAATDRAVDEYIVNRNQETNRTAAPKEVPAFDPKKPFTVEPEPVQTDMGNPITEPDQQVATELLENPVIQESEFDTSRPWDEYASAYDQSVAAAKEAALTAKAAAIPETRNQGVQYHGARGEVPELTEGYYNPDNIYGGSDTFYTTDALDVAKGYGRKNPNATIYQIGEREPVTFFDMEEPRTQADWEELLYGRQFSPDGGDAPSYIWHELQGIEQAAMDNGGSANLRQVMDEIRDSARGDGYSKDDVQDMFTAITTRLQELGFGGMRHVGGLKTKRSPHNVKIYFRPHEQLQLTRLDDAQWKPSSERQAEIDKAEAAIRNILEMRAKHEAAYQRSASPAVDAIMPSTARTGYHGSPTAGLGEIRTSERGALGPGAYFTPHRRVAERYGENVYEAEIPDTVFNGLGSMGDSSLNPYENWRNQMAQLVAAAPEEDRAAIQAIGDKQGPQGGYQLFYGIAQHYKSNEAARDLFKNAGFTGIAGWADGPEIAMFDGVKLPEAETPDLMAAKAAETPGPMTTQEVFQALDHGDRVVLKGDHGVEVEVTRTPDGMYRWGTNSPMVMTREGVLLQIGRGNMKAERAPDILEAKAASRTTGPQLRWQPQPGAIPTTGADIPRLRKTVKEMAADLRKALGVTHRQGRVGMKGALGTYNRKSGVVRTLAMHEMDVLSHETAHHLEFTKNYPALQAAMARHAPELQVLDYDPQAQRRHEGFAEWFRAYMTNPAVAQQIAPNFLPAFEAAMQKDLPKVFAKLKDIQSAHTEWANAASATRAIGDITYRKPEGAIERLNQRYEEGGLGGMGRSAYRALVDRLDPIARARDQLLDLIEAKTGKRVDLYAAYDPYKLARMLPGAFDAGHMDIVDGVAPYGDLHGQGASLSDALELALGRRTRGINWDQKAIEEFDAYLIARRMVGEWKRFMAGKLEQQPDRFSLEDHLQAIQTFEKNNPNFADAADMVYEWQNNLWQKKLDGGLIDGDTYLRGLEHEDYVPAMRDRDDVPGQDRGLGRTGDGEHAGDVKAFYGSTRQKISPIQSMMRDAYRTNMILARNDVYKALYKLAEQGGADAGKIVEKLPMQANVTNAMEVLTRASEQLGASPRDIANMLDDVRVAMGLKPGEDLMMYGPKGFDAKGEPVVYMWDKGQMVPLRIADGAFGEELMDALTNMTPDQRSIWQEVVAAPARIQRVGIVTHPSFILRNIFVDGITTWATTDVGYIPWWDSIRGVWHDLRQTDLAKTYSRAGGIIGGQGVAAERFTRINEDIKHLRKKGMRIRRFASPTGFFRAFAETAEMSETGTRLGVFDRGIKDNLKRGMNPREAIIEAAYQARDYMDFDMRGSAPGMRSLQSADTFLRSWVIGMDKMTKTLSGISVPKKVMAALVGGPPATHQEQRRFQQAIKAWSAISAMAVMSYGITKGYQDDPEYENINDDLRATHWIVKAPDWLPRYGGEWIFIPKPYEWAFPADVAERMVEAAAGDDTWANRIGSDAVNVFAPPHNIVALNLPLELAGNRNSMGQPIVPDHLTNMDPELQVTGSTSELAKGIGKMMKVSPAQVDHVIKSIGASWAREGIEGFDRTAGGGPERERSPFDDFLARRFVKDPARGSRAAETFWAKMSADKGEYTRALGSFQERQKSDMNAAFDGLEKLRPDVRSYVIMAGTQGLPTEMRRVHPMIMAQSIVSELSRLRADLREGNPRGAGLQPIELTPQERRQADEGLAQRIMAVQTNALAQAGVKGWENRAQLPEADLPPQVEGALAARLVGVLDPDSRLAAVNPAMATAIINREITEAGNAWNTLRPVVERLDRQRLQAYIEGQRAEGARGVDRFIRQVQPAR